MNIGPLLASPAFLGFSKVDSAEAQSRLRAILVDGGARWQNRMGQSGVLRFDAELRFFRYERMSQVHYRRDFGQVRELFINGTTDARGVGPRLAVSYEHQFGDRIRVGGQLGLAAPVGTLESHTLQEFVVDGDFDSATLAEEPGARRVFVQLEGEIGIGVRLLGRWWATGGYAFQQWSGVELNHRFIDVAAQSTAITVEGDVVFEGFLLGFRYAF